MVRPLCPQFRRDGEQPLGAAAEVSRELDRPDTSRTPGHRSQPVEAERRPAGQLPHAAQRDQPIEQTTARSLARGVARPCRLRILADEYRQHHAGVLAAQLGCGGQKVLSAPGEMGVQVCSGGRAACVGQIAGVEPRAGTVNIGGGLAEIATL